MKNSIIFLCLISVSFFYSGDVYADFPDDHSRLFTFSDIKWLSIVILSTNLCSFIYGIITVKKRIFPYNQLKRIFKSVFLGDSATLQDTKNENIDLNNYFHYVNRKMFFDQHGRQDYDIVFIGDSLTENAEWGDLFPSLRIANRGIDGDTTQGVLKRLDSIYSTNASKAFMMIGVNDLNSGRSVADIVRNYKKIVSKITNYGISVYIQSTILTGESLPKINAEIIELNINLKNFALQNPLILYIDLNTKLAPNGFLDPKYSNDSIHLNGDGYSAWKETIESSVFSSTRFSVKRV